MPGLSDLFGRGSIAEQMFVWGVLNNVITTAGGPFFQQLAYLVNEAHPVLELTPADLALVVVRHVRTRDQAAAEAKRSGLTGGRFDELVAITGDAPAPGELVVGMRRGLIPEGGTGPGAVSFDQGMAEGRIKDKWIPLYKGLAQIWPTPTDALEALLEGQIDQATARELYARFGGAPEFFTMLYNTRGQAPTPTQALELLNRGIITERGRGPDSTSYEQAFLEGPWRNKWLEPFLALRRYLPPPRTVTALLRNKSITEARALALFQAAGLSQQDAAAYVADATRQKTQTARELTESQIITLYEQHVITQPEAVGLLAKLGLDAHEASLLLTSAGVRVQVAQVNSAVTKVRSSYLARHIDAAQAGKALGALGVSGPAQANMLRVWAAELAATPAVLSAAQIISAEFYQIIPTAEAITRLVNRGYSPRDAWILLSDRHKTKLPGEPPR